MQVRLFHVRNYVELMLHCLQNVCSGSPSCRQIVSPNSYLWIFPVLLKEALSFRMWKILALVLVKDSKSVDSLSVVNSLILVMVSFTQIVTNDVKKMNGQNKNKNKNWNKSN